MQNPLERYFQECSEFSDYLVLDSEKGKSWDELSKQAPTLPKGWFELSQLKESVRLEFIHDFWLNAFSPIPHFYAFLDRFFSRVNHLNPCLAKHPGSEELKPYLAYVTDHTFFLGSPPMKEAEIEMLSETLRFPFPSDYLSFLRIHDGFFRKDDRGIFETASFHDEKCAFLKQKKNNVDPKILFPFYCKSQSSYYQCFSREWEADGEVGNVLFPPTYCKKEREKDTLPFCTFTDWLMIYLEEALG